MEIRKKIGAELAMHRKQLGMTQKQVAEISGIAQADLSRFEHGKGNITAETLERIATVMGLNIDVTFEEKKE